MKYRLTKIELAVLKLVEVKEEFPGHGLTLKSLERKNLIDHTRQGWRLTAFGYGVLHP